MVGTLKKENIYVPHNNWSYIVTTQSSKKYVPWKILIVSKTKLTIEQVIQRFKTNDYPDTVIISIEKVNVDGVQILEKP